MTFKLYFEKTLRSPKFQAFKVRQVQEKETTTWDFDIASVTSQVQVCFATQDTDSLINTRSC